MHTVRTTGNQITRNSKNAKSRKYFHLCRHYLFSGVIPTILNTYHLKYIFIDVMFRVTAHHEHHITLFGPPGPSHPPTN